MPPRCRVSPSKISGWGIDAKRPAAREDRRVREMPDSVPPPLAMDLLPDRGTGYEERVVELEPAALPHASGRDVDLTRPASACECGVGCGVLPDAAEASVAENRGVVVFRKATGGI